MKTKIHTISTEDIEKCFPVKEFVYKNPAPEPTHNDAEKSLDKILNIDSITNASIVCIDTYKYSLNDIKNILLIPVVINSIHDLTMSFLKKNEMFLFEGIEDPSVADTGDGGIYIFPTPLHAIAYIMWHEISLKLFNTYHITPESRKIVGKLSVRYSTTYDQIMKIGKNYYGPGIINAARMISTDRLNRCLIDEYSIDWFNRYFNGIENFITLSKKEIVNVLKNIFPSENFDFEEQEASIFQKFFNKHWGIKFCNVQHIGELKIKNTKISIYNFYILLLAGLVGRPEHIEVDEEVKLAVSIGNMNPIGIGENFG